LRCGIASLLLETLYAAAYTKISTVPEASGRLGISSLAYDNPSELQIIAGRQNQMASLYRHAPSRQMLRGNVVAPRNLGNDGTRNEQLGDNLRLLFVAPASPPAACENLKGPEAIMFHHMVNHVF
jgi:hypothetical protein